MSDKKLIAGVVIVGALAALAYYAWQNVQFKAGGGLQGDGGTARNPAVDASVSPIFNYADSGKLSNLIYRDLFPGLYENQKTGDLKGFYSDPITGGGLSQDNTGEGPLQFEIRGHWTWGN